MKTVKKLSILAIWLLFPWLVFAQAQTSVSDALQQATGLLTVTAAETFTTADGFTVLQGQQFTATIGQGGTFTVALYPTVGAAPYNAFYYADYVTTTSRVREQWTVPSSPTTPVTLAQVRVLWPQAPNVIIPSEQFLPPPTCTPSTAQNTNLVLRYTTPFIGWICAPDNVGTVSMDLENPTPSDSGVFQWEPKNGLKLTRIYCNVDQGTAAINLDVRTEANPNNPGSAVLQAPLVCTPNGTSTNVFVVTAVASETPVALLITNVTGAPTILRIHSEYLLN